MCIIVIPDGTISRGTISDGNTPGNTPGNILVVPFLMVVIPSCLVTAGTLLSKGPVTLRCGTAVLETCYQRLIMITVTFSKKAAET